MAALGLIGREREAGEIREFLHGLDGGAAGLVVIGEPGIGKTALWEKGVEEARGLLRVLVHRSVEAEAHLSFVGLSDLLMPVFDAVAPSLSPPRSDALEVALLLATPGEVAPDPRAVGLALLDVIRVLAEDGAVVLALDDLQWLDASSAAVLQIALRRLREEPVGLFATLRKAAGVEAGFKPQHAFREERYERLWLEPLSLAALYRLLKERLGLELTRSELARVRDASGGNPFFALELGRDLITTPSHRVAGAGLHVPESLRELLGGRLARLPADTVDLLVCAAALARPTVELLVSVSAERDSVIEALDAAVREGVVAFEGSRLRFSHPLLASICYEQALPAKRHDVHRALAEVVADVEERARHLALATDGPDAAVADELDRAAERAAARGAAATAAELCELSAELSPSRSARARVRRLRAADLHRFAGDGERAYGILSELLEEVPPGLERADILYSLASTFRADPARMAELCDEALAQAVGDDVRSARILALRTWVRLFELDITAALRDAREALEMAERAGDPHLLTVAIARLGQVETWSGEVTPGLLERGVEIERRLGLVLGYRESPSVPLGRLLMRLGELDRARGIFEDIESAAGARGDEATHVVVLWTLSMLEWLAGRLQRALEHATAACELGEQTQDLHTRAWVGRVKAVVEADLGLAAEARASAAEGLAASEASSNEFFTVASLGALGRLELASGNLAAAGEFLRELPGRLHAAGMDDPTNPIWADAIETLIGLGDLGQATAYLEQYEQHAQRLGSSWALAAASRCRGLLAAAEGDIERARTMLERAHAEVERSPYPLERGRTLLCLGVVRRQGLQKKAAREALEQAVGIFEELGARLWAAKARGELRRISGRRASGDELTETEARVATMAVEGLSNKEIAAALFMGVSTVEAHLSHVYRKLGIRSRGGLASRLAIRPDDVPNPVDEAVQT
jgi:ATP/maltotriose-dependent transcriptional regulator MalT